MTGYIVNAKDKQAFCCRYMRHRFWFFRSVSDFTGRFLHGSTRRMFCNKHALIIFPTITVFTFFHSLCDVRDDGKVSPRLITEYETISEQSQYLRSFTHCDRELGVWKGADNAVFLHISHFVLTHNNLSRCRKRGGTTQANLDEQSQLFLPPCGISAGAATPVV